MILALKVHLVSQGKRQRELARVTGRSDSFVSDVANCQREADDEFKQMSAEFLGIPEEELFRPYSVQASS